MIIDTRSVYQRAKDSVRCPTCGHRPQDATDELWRREMGGGFSVGQQTCSACDGSGIGATTPEGMMLYCTKCRGSGIVGAPR